MRERALIFASRALNLLTGGAWELFCTRAYRSGWHRIVKVIDREFIRRGHKPNHCEACYRWDRRHNEKAKVMLNDKQQAQFNTVCERIAKGKSLVSICKRKGMPGYGAVTRWLREDAEGSLQTMYAQAREAQADYLADEIVAIADSKGEPAQVRNRVDARKWVAAKLRPRVYGEKLALGGAEDLPAIRQEVQERADSFTTGIAGMVARGKVGKGDTRH